IVRRRRPAVVLSLGGYASVPCAVAALIWRVPVVVAEQNAVPGAANRLVSRWARACAVSFAGTELPKAEFTGNPVRHEVLAVDRSDSAARDAARRRLGVGEGRRFILAFGGSLGALRINRAVADAATALEDRADLAVRHVIGRRDWDEFSELRNRAFAGLEYTAVEYEHDMPSALLAADLVICRSGASSVAELAAAGVPAVLVPLPGAPGDHQTANARALVDAGAARMIVDADMAGPRLVREIEELDATQLAAMGAAAARTARRDAASSVGALLVRHAARPPLTANEGSS
ncbi:MAG: glycosyltransferase, partial [Acidimicrobiales bacterium]|nr:glycosyltransferase [Acidimicrobiales bacterium]